MDLSPVLPVGAVVLFGGLIVLGIVARSNRANSLLEDWARENNYTLLRAEYSMWPGPFLFRAGKSSAVYRIAVRDESGRERTGYARCGGFWLGMWLSNSVTVEWDAV